MNTSDKKRPRDDFSPYKTVADTLLQRTTKRTLQSSEDIQLGARARITALRAQACTKKRPALRDPARRDAVEFLLYESQAWNLGNATTHGCVALFDRVSFELCVVESFAPRFVALACLWIQCKMHEARFPSASKILQRLRPQEAAFDAFDARANVAKFIETESRVLRAAAWSADMTTPWTWLNLIALASGTITCTQIEAANNELLNLLLDARTRNFSDEALAWATLAWSCDVVAIDASDASNSMHAMNVASFARASNVPLSPDTLSAVRRARTFLCLETIASTVQTTDPSNTCNESTTKSSESSESSASNASAQLQKNQHQQIQQIQQQSALCIARTFGLPAPLCCV